MNIEDAIKYLRSEALNLACHGQWNKAEKLEQIAQWLEELKELKEKEKL